MNIWTVANQKGGVGKTTTSIALGGLAAEQGRKVLLIDTDPHGSLTAFFRLNPDEQQHSTFSLFEQREQLNEFGIRRCVCETNQQNLHLLPASSALMSIDRQAVGADGMGLVLSRALRHLRSAFDLVIVDGPPMAGVLLVNAVLAAEQLIIPTQTEYLALQGVARLLTTTKLVWQNLPAAEFRSVPYLIVPTLHDRRTQASISALERLRGEYGSRVWGSQIATDTKLRDAMENGVMPHKVLGELSSINAYRSLLGTLLAVATKQRPTDAMGR